MNIKMKKMSLFSGRSIFTGEKTLQVRLNDGRVSEELTAENIVIANGAKTRVPDDIQEIQDIDYLTSESFSVIAFQTNRSKA